MANVDIYIHAVQQYAYITLYYCMGNTLPASRIGPQTSLLMGLGIAWPIDSVQVFSNRLYSRCLHPSQLIQPPPVTIQRLGQGLCMLLAMTSKRRIEIDTDTCYDTAISIGSICTIWFGPLGTNPDRQALQNGWG